jgi:hypothetical protein
MLNKPQFTSYILYKKKKSVLKCRRAVNQKLPEGIGTVIGSRITTVRPWLLRVSKPPTVVLGCQLTFITWEEPHVRSRTTYQWVPNFRNDIRFARCTNPCKRICVRNRNYGRPSSKSTVRSAAIQHCARTGQFKYVKYEQTFIRCSANCGLSVRRYSSN